MSRNSPRLVIGVVALVAAIASVRSAAGQSCEMNVFACSPMERAIERARARRAEAHAETVREFGIGRSPAAAVLPAGADGHFIGKPSLNGVPVEMMVDTGASFVALTPADAAAVGIDVADLIYDFEIWTPAGPARAATATVGTLSFAGLTFSGVGVIILPKGAALGPSLMGMPVLRHFSIEVTNGQMALRPL